MSILKPSKSYKAQQTWNAGWSVIENEENLTKKCKIYMKSNNGIKNPSTCSKILCSIWLAILG